MIHPFFAMAGVTPVAIEAADYAAGRIAAAFRSTASEGRAPE